MEIRERAKLQLELCEKMAKIKCVSMSIHGYEYVHFGKPLSFIVYVDCFKAFKECFELGLVDTPLHDASKLIATFVTTESVEQANHVQTIKSWLVDNIIKPMTYERLEKQYGNLDELNKNLRKIICEASLVLKPWFVELYQLLECVRILEIENIDYMEYAQTLYGINVIGAQEDKQILRMKQVLLQNIMLEREKRETSKK